MTASDPTDQSQYGLSPIVSNPFTVSAGVPAQLVFTTQPGNGTGGTPLTQQPVVYIEDAQGNLVTTDNTTVTLAIGTNPGPGTLSNCTAQASAGIATFTGCTIDKIGTGYTLTATDATDNLTTPSAPSGPFNITPGQPYRLAFTTTPGTTVAGDQFANQPVVTLLDAGGNTATVAPGSTDAVGIAIGPSSPGGTLSGCTETTTAGVASFTGCSISTPGVGYTLVATDTTNPAVLSATSGSFNVVTPALTSFKVSTPATNTPTVGTAFNVTITALDQSGYQFPGFSGTQTIAFSGPANSPNGNAPVYPASVSFTNGVGTASVTLFDAQTTTLTATQGTVMGTSGNMTVKPLGTATALSVGNPGGQTAGSSFNETIDAVDQYGNTVTAYSASPTVTFIGPSNSPSGKAPTYPGTLNFTNGVATPSLTLYDAQSTTLKATILGGVTGTSTSFTVSPGTTTTLVVSAFPSPVTAGTAHSVTVTAFDAYGNTTPSYTGTVHFTSTDPQATAGAGLPANYTFTTGTGADNGTHTFTNGVTLKTAGTQSITATDTVTGTIKGTQSGITVNPTGAATLTVSGFPSPTTAGAAHSVTVTAHDAYGNTATGYTGTVHFTSSDGAAVLPANYTFVAGDNGVHTFTNGATLKTAGTQSITATDTVTGTITGTQSAITVNPAGAATLTVTGFTSPTTAGAAHSVTVTAFDAFGNTATGYTGTVHFTSTDGQATAARACRPTTPSSPVTTGSTPSPTGSPSRRRAPSPSRPPTR